MADRHVSTFVLKMDHLLLANVIDPCMYRLTTRRVREATKNVFWTVMETFRLKADGENLLTLELDKPWNPKEELHWVVVLKSKYCTTLLP